MSGALGGFAAADQHAFGLAAWNAQERGRLDRPALSVPVACGTLDPVMGLVRAQGGTSTAMGPSGAGLLTYGANQPRYSGVGRNLLIEPLAQNLLLQSNLLTSASWVKTRLSTPVADPVILAPDGTSAFQFAEDSTAAQTHVMGQAGVVYTAGVSYTASVMVQQATRNWGHIQFQATAFGTVKRAFFDASAGAWGTVTAGVTAHTPQYIGAGWWRFSASCAATITNTGNNIFIGLASADNTPSYSGLGGGFYLLFGGAQFEATSYPTTYIPTGASALSRDDDSLTTAASGLFGANRGTVVMDWQLRSPLASGTFPVGISLYDASSNWIGIYANSGSGVLDLTANVNSTNVYDTSTLGHLGTYVTGAPMRAAFSFDGSGAGGTHSVVAGANVAGSVVVPTPGAGLTLFTPSTFAVGRYVLACTAPMQFSRVQVLPYAVSSGQLAALLGA